MPAVRIVNKPLREVPIHNLVIPPWLPQKWEKPEKFKDKLWIDPYNSLLSPGELEWINDGYYEIAAAAHLLRTGLRISSVGIRCSASFTIQL